MMNRFCWAAWNSRKMWHNLSVDWANPDCLFIFIKDVGKMVFEGSDIIFRVCHSF